MRYSLHSTLFRHLRGVTDGYGAGALPDGQLLERFLTRQEVTDPTLADVTLNMDTTSAVGGYADGVLGCTTDAGQITIIQGWNFYAGSDATQIGSDQYDFETVVTHELGHALGLGHSTDSTSVMYATLNTGTVNRMLTTADLNMADSDTTGACGLHAMSLLVSPTETGRHSTVPVPRTVSAGPIRSMLISVWLISSPHNPALQTLGMSTPAASLPEDPSTRLTGDSFTPLPRVVHWATYRGSRHDPREIHFPRSRWRRLSPGVMSWTARESALIEGSYPCGTSRQSPLVQ